MEFIILIQSIGHSDCFSVSQSLIHVVARWLVPLLSHSPHQSLGCSVGRSVGRSVSRSVSHSDSQSNTKSGQQSVFESVAH